MKKCSNCDGSGKIEDEGCHLCKRQGLDCTRCFEQPSMVVPCGECGGYGKVNEENKK